MSRMTFLVSWERETWSFFFLSICMHVFSPPAFFLAGSQETYFMLAGEWDMI